MTVTVNSAGSEVPRLLSVSPNSGKQGQSLPVTITGEFTNFVQGATRASLGDGVSIGGSPEGELAPVTVTTPTTAVAHLAIADRAAWSEVLPAGQTPLGRIYRSQAYDPISKQLIVFGGTPMTNNFTLPHLNDVWLLRGADGIGPSAWTQAVPGGALPSPRSATTAVYDAPSDRMMIFADSLAPQLLVSTKRVCW